MFFWPYDGRKVFYSFSRYSGYFILPTTNVVLCRGGYHTFLFSLFSHEQCSHYRKKEKRRNLFLANSHPCLGKTRDPEGIRMKLASAGSVLHFFRYNFPGLGGFLPQQGKRIDDQGLAYSSSPMEFLFLR